MEPSPCVLLSPRGGKQRLACKAKHDARFVAVGKHLIRADVGFVMLLTRSEMVQGPGVSQHGWTRQEHLLFLFTARLIVLSHHTWPILVLTSTGSC